MAKVLAFGCERTERVKNLQYGRVGQVADWFIPPRRQDRPSKTSRLLLLHTGHVPFDPTRLSESAHDSLRRPDLVATAWSYLREICLFATSVHEGLAPLWLSEFVLYVLCGVTHIKKTMVEGEVYVDHQRRS